MSSFGTSCLGLPLGLMQLHSHQLAQRYLQWLYACLYHQTTKRRQNLGVYKQSCATITSVLLRSHHIITQSLKLKSQLQPADICDCAVP